MKLPNQSRLRVSWVLANQLGVGPAPLHASHIQHLQEQGVQAVLSLCSAEEAPPPVELSQTFPHQRLVLPDHRTGRLPDIKELLSALNLLNTLQQKHGAVFVHCVAAVERSPLVCMSWLVQQQKLSPNVALDYLMQVHPPTNPLPGQLALLRHPALR